MPAKKIHSAALFFRCVFMPSLRSLRRPSRRSRKSRVYARGLLSLSLKIPNERKTCLYFYAGFNQWPASGLFKPILLVNSRCVNNRASHLPGWPGFPAYLCLDVDVAGLLILQRANHANENGQFFTGMIQKDDRGR